MDRISALRNLEDALAAFEEGEVDLATLEHQVQGILRTYATEFEGDLQAYRAQGPPPVDGLVVMARSHQQATERVRSLVPDSRTVPAAQIEVRVTDPTTGSEGDS